MKDHAGVGEDPQVSSFKFRGQTRIMECRYSDRNGSVPETRTREPTLLPFTVVPVPCGFVLFLKSSNREHDSGQEWSED